MEVYVDLGSQPSRTVLLFCRLNSIPVKEVLLQIAKGQNRSKEQLAINPIGKVPYLRDGDFILPESAAICRYLAATHHVPDHWYPKDPRQRAKVDAALDWHHGNVRWGAAKLGWHRVLATLMAEGQPNPVIANEAEKVLKMSLKLLETYWLASTPFVAGEQVSIPDLLMACELEQLIILDGASQGPTLAQLLAPFPAVCAWRERVVRATSPHWVEVHKLLGRIRDRAVTAKQQTAGKL